MNKLFGSPTFNSSLSSIKLTESLNVLQKRIKINNVVLLGYTKTKLIIQKQIYIERNTKHFLSTLNGLWLEGLLCQRCKGILFLSHRN